MDRASQIHNGDFKFPVQIADMVEATDIQREVLDSMFYCLLNNFMEEVDTDIISYIDILGNEFMNKVLYHLFRANWIDIDYRSNYVSMKLKQDKLLKWTTLEELTKLKFNSKITNNLLPTTPQGRDDLVAINGFPNLTTKSITRKIVKTGLIRKGFNKASGNMFKLDTKYLKIYKDEIANNILKGYEGSIKDIKYDEIVKDLLDVYANSPTVEYCLGKNISDSRGRSIFYAATKAVNPISSKDIRACIKCTPKKVTSLGLEGIYLSIVELLGCKSNCITTNVVKGYAAWCNKELPSPQGDDLHVFIWLSRIYESLDCYVKDKNYLWDVPLELDVTSSVLAIMGLLMNHHEYLNLTNLIGDELLDAWTIDGLTRKQIKTAMTPALYGSAATPQALWDKAKLDYDQNSLNIINEETSCGRYSDAICFKDFIINNVKPSPKMNIQIGDENFDIYCNRFNWESAATKIYKVFTGNRVERITREVVQVYDLQQFKRYFVTLLIHNLDSQIADNICDNLDWVIPNHDAFIVHPSDIQDLRDIYIHNIKYIYKDRKEILSNYFQSIGIDQEWEERKEDFELALDVFNPNSLK